MRDDATAEDMREIYYAVLRHPALEGSASDRAVAGMLIPVTVLAAVSLLMGLGAGPCMRLALDGFPVCGGLGAPLVLANGCNGRFGHLELECQPAI